MLPLLMQLILASSTTAKITALLDIGQLLGADKIVQDTLTKLNVTSLISSE